MEEKISEFKKRFSILQNTEEIFLIMLLLTRQYGSKLRNINIKEVERIMCEDKIIYNVIKDFNIKEILCQLDSIAIEEMVLYIEKFIESQVLDKDIIASDNIEWIAYKIWGETEITINNIRLLEKYIRGFSMRRTDAELIIIDNNEILILKKIIMCYLNQGIKVKILSFNYELFSEKDYKEICRKMEIRKISINNCEFVTNIKLQRTFLHNLITEMDPNTFIMILGIEKFITNQRVLETAYFKNMHMRIHSQVDNNWKDFVLFLDCIFSECLKTKKYLTMVYHTDNSFNPASVISEVAKDIDSFSITYMCYDIPIYHEILDDLINVINNKMEEEKFYDKLEKSRNDIGEDNYNYINGIKLLIQGDLYSAELYISKCENINLENKSILADLYIGKKKYDKSLQYLKEIYRVDKYRNGLLSSILYIFQYLGDIEEFEYWFSEAKNINDEDLDIYLYAANFYTNHKLYKRSSEEWDRLYNLTNNGEYEVLTKINILLHDIEKYNVIEIEQELNSYFIKYPDLNSELHYRIGIIMARNKKKYINALEHLCKVDSNLESSFSYEAANERLRLYRDKLLGMNVSTNPINKNDFLLYATELVKDLPIITYKKQSVDYWENFINSVFPYKYWKENIVELILQKIEKWSRISPAIFEQTCINVDLSKNMDIKDIYGEYVLQSNSIDDNILLLFFNSIFLCSAGRYQEANDSTFTLFRMSESLVDIKYINASIIFGLTAWGNTYYKMHEEVESIISIIAAIDYGVQCSEVANVFWHGFPIIVDFLFNHCTELNMQKRIDIEEPLNSLCKYTDVTTNKIKYICGKKDEIKPLTIILKMEEIWDKNPDMNLLINIKDDEQLQVLEEISIMIRLYDKNNQLTKACRLINKFKNTYLLNLGNDIGISYFIYFEWADILYRNKLFNDALEILNIALSQVEQMRTVYHQRERSFIGEQAYNMYRKYLEIRCVQFAKENNAFCFNKNDLCAVMNLIPKSIIEQKNFTEVIYYNNDLDNILEKYYEMFSGIVNMQKKGLDNTAHFKEMLKEFLECKELLVKEHPAFASLPVCTYENDANDNLNNLKNNLDEDEIFYQIIRVNNFLIHFVITHNHYELICTQTSLRELDSLCEILKQHIKMKDFDLKEEKNAEVIIECCDRLSEICIKPLYKYIELEKYKKLYFMPDYTMTYISMNLMRYKKVWIIEKFKSIENLVDYAFKKHEYTKQSREQLAYSFNKQDINIAKILKVVKKYQTVQLNSEENENIDIHNNVEDLILIGHGVSQKRNFDYIGAKDILQSNKKKLHIDLKSFLNIEGSVKNALVISCSSGTLTNDYIERNEGIWGALFNKKIDYIMYCKWDVSTEYTGILLDKILSKLCNDNTTLSQALCRSQRELCNIHPILWAGLEVWKNR